MHSSVSKKATENFYDWEVLGRGELLFKTPVDIEPPYIPFKKQANLYSNDFDDGKEFSLIQLFLGLFSNNEKPKIEKDEKQDIVPNFLSFKNVPNLKGLQISFTGKYDILPTVVNEFLNIISYTTHSVSFEIIGTFEDIKIQIVCSEQDFSTIESQLKSYFPQILIVDLNLDDDLTYELDKTIVVDYALEQEFTRPIKTCKDFGIDPLTSIIGTVDQLREDESFLLQIIFKGVNAPWARNIVSAVSDGNGGSFFSDTPEMLTYAKEKIKYPLFSVVVRTMVSGITLERSKFITTTIAGHLSNLTNSGCNKLIPMSNEGYNFDFHIYNVQNRLSNRLGFIANTHELSTLVHYPNRTIVSEYLHKNFGNSRAVPKQYRKGTYQIGTNFHKGLEYDVCIGNQEKLRHTHIIGATGVGKSTLMANLILDDIHKGNGVFLFDPHGDIVEDIICRIPKNRINDVVVVDPYDTDFPIGFNLLSAKTDAEKIVLSSDIVNSFRRFATSWGDNMSSVLSQAINTFLESSTGGTLIELKRFLLEDKFRNEFLKNIDDPSILYYWKNEYYHLKKRIAPLLTRIDTFLRPKIIRYMLVQKGGIDFTDCIEQKKIVLLKLSRGLIGKENSFLLGSLFLSKINQVALGRQSISKAQRHPFFVYLDEFQNFITPSISDILSGSRKYGLGLVLAHQELAQIDDYQVLNSVLSNPNIRICFKLGDSDAKRLQDGFSHFESKDLQGLNIGEAIMRIGSSSNDFNLETKMLTQELTNFNKDIISNVRSKYATSRVEVEDLLNSIFSSEKDKATNSVETIPDIQVTKVNENIKSKSQLKSEEKVSANQRDKLIKEENESLEIKAHTYLQSVIKKLGQDRNFKSTKEFLTKDGGRIDVVLEQNGLKIGFEISETNTPEYEVRNIKKCLKEGCLPVVVVSKNRTHLNAIKKLAEVKLSKKDYSLVQFLQPDEISNLLDEIVVLPKSNEEYVKGFRIVTEIEGKEDSNLESIKSRLARIFRRKK